MELHVVLLHCCTICARQEGLLVHGVQSLPSCNINVASIAMYVSIRYINYRAAEKSRALGKSTDVCIEVAGMSHNLGGSPVWLLLPGV